MASDRRAVGTVESYDDHVGAGWVVTDTGQRHWFHCTQIADDSRHIDPGTVVGFEIAAGVLGRWEARSLHTI